MYCCTDSLYILLEAEKQAAGTAVAVQSRVKVVGNGQDSQEIGREGDRASRDSSHTAAPAWWTDAGCLAEELLVGHTGLAVEQMVVEQRQEGSAVEVEETRWCLYAAHRA